jgi:ParB family chromosome partitioning protein
MADSRRGLGRGLSALLGEAEDIAHAVDPAQGVRELPIELVRRNPGQPRQTFPEAELEELAASIRQSGILQPILVRPAAATPGEYEIVAGERRWRAAQKAGLRSIPALVRELGDDQAYEIAVVENVQRADLNPLEEAEAYSQLMRRMAYTQDQVAGAVGKSRSHVANTLRLMQLPDDVQRMVLVGSISAGHARAILAAEDPVALARQIVAKGLTVRHAEALAKSGGKPKKASGPRRAPKDTDTAALEADLEDVLGMSVDITDRGGSGELKIRYQTLEQLDELCRRLTRS